MILVGEITGNLRRLAILIARRANARDQLLVWVSGKGSIWTSPVATREANQVLAEASPLIVGAYGVGARAVDILADLELRAQEMKR